MTLPMTTPIPHSYWVVKGKFLAGEYPRCREEDASLLKMQSILQSGITHFIDLTEADEGLEPYDRILTRLGASHVVHQRFPIQDRSIPRTPADMVAILDAIDGILEAGHTLYLHCWGGVGRTGTVVGCWLARHGFAGEAALKELRELWQHCAKSTSRETPERYEQEQFVICWPSPPVAIASADESKSGAIEVIDDEEDDG